jgi:hypothetical protein
MQALLDLPERIRDKIEPEPNSGGWRACQTCHRLDAAASYSRRKHGVS